MLLLVSTTCGPILTEGFSILTTIWCLAFLGIFLSSGFLELHTFSNTVRTLEFTLFKREWRNNMFVSSCVFF